MNHGMRFTCMIGLMLLESINLANCQVVCRPAASPADAMFDDLHLDSKTGDGPFAFQYTQGGGINGVPRFARMRLASSDPAPTLVVFWKGRFPITLIKGERGWDTLIPEKAEEHRVNWLFLIDGPHLDRENLIFLESDEGARIHFELQSCLEQYFDEEGMSVQQFAKLQIILWQSDAGITITVQEKTPNDVVRFGYALALLDIEKLKLHVQLNGLTSGTGRDDFGKTPEIPEIPAKLADPLERVLASDRWEPFDAGFILWQSMADFTSPEQRKSLKQQWAAMLGRSIKSEEARDELADFCWRLAELVSACENDELPIDDFSIRQCRTEQITCNQWWMIYTEVLPGGAKNMSVSFVLSIFDAVIDMGIPPTFQPVKDLVSSTDPVYEAVMFARHRRPWTEDHVAACLKHLPDMPAGSGGELALVKTLILMDEINQVPAIRVEHWYKSQIVDGSRFEQLDGLRQLTLMPTGRAWLRQRVKTDLRDPADVKLLGCSALRQRAEATLQTKQWDFMSEAECQETLTLLTELEPQLKQPAVNLQ